MAAYNKEDILPKVPLVDLGTHLAPPKDKGKTVFEASEEIEETTSKAIEGSRLNIMWRRP